MPRTPQDYRQQAEEAEASAAQARDAEMQEMFLDFAKSLRELADEVERRDAEQVSCLFASSG